MVATAYTKVRKDQRYSGFPSVRRRYAQIDGFKQKPITDKPLPFVLLEGDVHTYANLNAPGRNTAPPDCLSTAFTDVMMGRITGPLNSLDNAMQICYNRAYSKFFSKVGESAELGTALAEWRKTVDMVNNRTLAAYQRQRANAVRQTELKALRLVKAFRYLKRGNFKKFREFLGVKPKKKHQRKQWSRPQEASSLWLEYWFGWSPTVNDIYTSLKIWDAPSPDAVFSAGSGFVESKVLTYSSTSSLYSRNAWTAKFFVRLQAKVLVSNPNLYRANQLGLVNPAGVLWELVPFSFLIDWFTNVNQVIGGYTSEVGLSITDKQVVRFCKGDSTSVLIGNLNFPSAMYGWNCASKTTLMKRELGSFPTPSLTFSAPRMSWTRAATAISLLISVFSKKLP